MRMAGPDIVLFVVGALVFSGATFAIIQQDGGFTGAASPVGLFTVTFQPADTEIANEAVADLRTATTTVAVNQTNIVAVNVRVDCSDTPAGTALPFQIQLAVEGPGGLTGEGAGTCGQEVAVQITVGAVPEPTTAQGALEAEARENLDASLPPSTAGQGDWTITVSGARQGAPVGLPAGNPGGAIVMTLTQYVPSFAPVQR